MGEGVELGVEYRVPVRISTQQRARLRAQSPLLSQEEVGAVEKREVAGATILPKWQIPAQEQEKTREPALRRLPVPERCSGARGHSRTPLKKRRAFVLTLEQFCQEWMLHARG